ncbi:MAG: hypothetical protein ABIP56_08670 [Dokdonella sp.]
MSPDQPPELPTPPDVAAEQQFAEQKAKAAEAASESRPAGHHDDGVLDHARELFSAAVETFTASLALVRAEFHLARNSALFLFAMSCVLIVLGVGTWLGLLALLAAGVARLAGSWSIGIATVVLVNSIGGVWVFFMIRRSFRDMSMPRTRRLIAGMRPQEKAPDPTEEPNEQPDGIAT